VLCPLYLYGFCPKGPECEFTHPKFDFHNLNLRIRPDNLIQMTSKHVDNSKEESDKKEDSEPKEESI